MTMTPTQTVQAFLDAFARHDVDAAIAVVDPQVSVTVHPFGLESSGADVLRGVLADLVRGFPDLMITVSRVITTGDVVTALFKAEGTQAAGLRRRHQPGEAPGYRSGLAVRDRRRADHRGHRLLVPGPAVPAPGREALRRDRDRLRPGETTMTEVSQRPRTAESAAAVVTEFFDRTARMTSTA
jgi:Ketosteroid isomerase-related protein